MSWFDTAGIAILAKNALKEAQKQIDKALDIKEDEDDVPRKQQSTGLPRNQSDDEISIEDDSFSYTLSEQTVTMLDIGKGLAPITVAPSRSNHSFKIANVPSLNVIKRDCSAVHTLNENSMESVSAPTVKLNVSKTSNHATQHQQEFIETSMKTSHSTRISLHEQDLDQSYENVELKAHIFDLTHSFEEIKSDNNIADNISNSEADRDNENLSHLVDFGHNVFNNPVDDEIETTASSDIEIISSPNCGDSSSTHSSAYRTSPLKINNGKNENFDVLLIKKRHRHTREPSEISVHSANSDESVQLSETDRLMRRLVEVSETLEQREYRLVELGRQNAELNENNAQLIAQLENKAKRDGGMDLDEYMQRLSALERKFQQSIREKETLKYKLEVLQTEAQEKVTRGEVDKAIAERDFMINELQKEGENLSKQVLQHSNLIKKLRTKEKECDTLIRKQCDEIIELMQEAERLKRTLSAKDEVERSQIEAVHKLTSEKRQLERECTILNGNLEDQIQKYETLRKSFDFSRNELNEKSEQYQDLQKRLAKLQHYETEFLSMQRSNAQLTGQMEELREQLRRTEIEYGQRLNRVKSEHAELLLCLEATKTVAEEEKNSSALLTVPLIKQLDSLQNSLRYKERLWEERDNSFAQQLADGLERINLVVDKEKLQCEQIFFLQHRISLLEDRLAASLLETEELSNKLKQKTNYAELLEQEYRKELKATGENREPVNGSQIPKSIAAQFQHNKTSQKMLTSEISDQQWVNPSCSSMHEDEFAHKSTETSNEDRLLDRNAEINIRHVSRCTETSPVPSIGNVSLPESLTSIPWNIPEDATSVETGADPTEAVEYNVSVLLNNTTLLETLQAALKQRDGEVYQLQWEVSRFQQERNVLSSEISKLTMELDNVRERFDRSILQEKEHSELQNRYDALLQMYGESVEKTEELQLDLADVKEMYKMQIDDLLKRQRELTSSIPNNC
uniref:TATA element modulatory factor 1 TATA binding domain-containing protein n=1 Tax=Anopheles farauti TaxID=69004 RepID=A0A182QNC1_9DIPT